MDPEFSKLNQDIRGCTKCSLSQTRTHAVCGEGNRRSGIVFIAQAPGEREDKQNQMFIGPSGKWLKELLSGAGIGFSEFYMTNLIKCYIPKCRRPSKNEIEQCAKHLEKELNIINPKLIVPLGFHATRYVFRRFGLERPVSKEYHVLFGKLFKAGNRLIFPLRHPAALLFNPEKRSAIQENYNKLRSLFDHLQTDRMLTIF